MAKITQISEEEILFDNGYKLFSTHQADCCEHHYLACSYVKPEEVAGLEFDLDSDNFFEKVDGYGIKLLPTNGHPIPVPGYGYNNGYYGTNLALVLSRPNQQDKEFDITECQVISG